MKKLILVFFMLLFASPVWSFPTAPGYGKGSNPEFESASVGTTGSITEETNTMTFDDGDGAPITLQTIRDGAGGADGTAIHDDEANEITAITIKATPVDADEFIQEDSAAAFVKKAVTWAAIKATLKTYNDSLYSATGALMGVWGASSEITLTAGGVAVLTTQGYFTIDTNADDATDDLTQITGLATGDEIIIAPDNDGRTVIVKNGVNLILCNGADFTMNNSKDRMVLQDIGADVLVEISRSSGGD